MATAYCVKCKAQRDILDPQQITMKNGRPATQGRCPVCGTKIFKIGALETAEKPEPAEVPAESPERDGEPAGPEADGRP